MHKDPITGQMVDTDVKGPLDYLSRMDDLMVNLTGLVQVQNQTMAALLKAQPAAGTTQSAQDLRQQYESGAFYPYDTWPANTSQSMATAVSNQEIAISGDSISCWTDGDLSGIGVRLNRQDAPLVYFNQVNPIVGISFWKIYLTFNMQVNNTMRLFVGRGGVALSTSSSGKGNSAPVSQDIFSISSIHFTGAITQNAIEIENIATLTSPRIRITSISILSEQALDYRLIFYHRPVWDTDSIDRLSYCGEQELNLATNGFLVAGAAAFYLMTLEDLAIDYEDYNAAPGSPGQILYVALQNLSATSKLASASGGKVVIKLTYEQLPLGGRIIAGEAGYPLPGTIYYTGIPGGTWAPLIPGMTVPSATPISLRIYWQNYSNVGVIVNHLEMTEGANTLTAVSGQDAPVANIGTVEFSPYTMAAPATYTFVATLSHQGTTLSIFTFTLVAA